MLGCEKIIALHNYMQMSQFHLHEECQGLADATSCPQDCHLPVWGGPCAVRPHRGAQRCLGRSQESPHDCNML